MGNPLCEPCVASRCGHPMTFTHNQFMTEPTTPDPPPLLQQQAALVLMPGYAAITVVTQLQRISGLFSDNYSDLRQIVDAMQDPGISLPILDLNNRDRHDAYLSKCERLLHNTLSAAMSRVDQQRRLFQEDREPILANLTFEYKNRVAAEFASNGLAKFVQDLRNLLVHRGLPLTFSRIDFSEATNLWKVTLYLDITNLRQWSRWASPARRWLESRADDIDVIATLQEYKDHVVRFDDWIQSRIANEHQEQIADFETARLAYNEAYEREFDF